MKLFNKSLTIVSLIILLTSCSSLTSSFIRETESSSHGIGKVASELFYDSVYYSIEYYLTNNIWPTSKEDLINQGKLKNITISLDQYKYFGIEQCSKNRINIHFVISQMKMNKQLHHDIKGIIGIYIEDKNKINLNTNVDNRILCSFTIGQYPYAEQNSVVTNGYNVHIYIENNNKNSINKGNFTIVDYPMKRVKKL